MAVSYTHLEALRNYREALASKGNSIKLENDETQQTIEGTITRINQDVDVYKRQIM